MARSNRYGRGPEVVLHEDWIGHRVTDLEQATGARVAFLVRFGAGMFRNRNRSSSPATRLCRGDIGRAAEAVAIAALPPRDLYNPTTLNRETPQPPTRWPQPGLGAAQMKVAVAGAGAVGRSVTRELVGNGHE